MGRYVARRLIQFIPVILGTLFLLHLLSVLTIQIVGDPVRALFGANAPPDAVIEQLQAAVRPRRPVPRADRQPVRRACSSTAWASTPRATSASTSAAAPVMRALPRADRRSPPG